MLKRVLVGLAVTLASLTPAHADGFFSPKRPKLLVFIAVDQLRADALMRFSDLLLPAHQANGHPGGFRYLQAEGVDQAQCYLDHLPCHTAAGHATLATGAPPSVHGIVANWWTFPETGKATEAYTDPAWPQISPNAKLSAAPTLLQGSTFSDEIKLASIGRSKVYSISVKTRAAVLMGGHQADLALWLDNDSGGWTSSRYYLHDGKLPGWLTAFNGDGWIQKFLGWQWNRLRSGDDHSRPGGLPGTYPKLATPFPHVLASKLDKHFFEDVASSPLGITWSFRLGEKIIEQEHLGKGTVPDVLCMSMSSHDKMGHLTGPYSPEMEDTFLRLDQDLAEFLGYLQDHVGLDNCVIVLTADHGGAPVPEQAEAYQKQGGRGSYPATEARLEAALAHRFGPGKYVASFSEPHIVLSRKNLKPEDMPEARKVARDACLDDPTIQSAFTREEIMTGSLPHTPLGDSVSRSYFPGRSGDVFIVNKPFWIYSFEVPYGSTHGAPYTYDTHIPLLMCGPGLKKGRKTERCAPEDMVATICELFRVNQPSGCRGRVLTESVVPDIP